MTISEVAIKNHVFAWMFMAAMILFGAISFSRMGVSHLPDVDFPVVNVSVTYEGAAPEVVETDVVDVIENSVMSVEGVREINSSARHGSASISIELELGRDVDAALQEVQTNIARAQRLLPDDIETPIISKRNPEDFPIMWVAVSYDGPTRDLMEYTRNHIRDRFQTLPGVADVRLGGYVDRSMRIWLDRDRMNRLELTVDDILNAIGREHVEMPGGLIETRTEEMVVRSRGEVSTVQELENIPITSRGGAPVHRTILLKDVADVVDGLDDIRRVSRFNGVQSVGLGIMKQRGANTIDIAEETRELTEYLQGSLPEGFNISVSNDRTVYVKDSNDQMVFTIILATLLTGLVCFLFLGSPASTLNIFLAIPTALMGTFIFLYFIGFTLNIFTMLALTLAIGIVVDDTIMVMENISRYREQGYGRIEAAVMGARQITFAAVATTLSVISIFIPVAFMQGVIGRFFLEFAAAITIAVAISLVEALTLTPMRCSRFAASSGNGEKIGPAKITDIGIKVLTAWYSRAVGFILGHRGVVMLLAFIFFAGSLMLLAPMKKEFTPSQDMSMFIMRLRTPPGSALEYTDKLTRDVEKLIAARGEVERYFTAVGGFGGGQSNSAMIFVTLKSPGDRPVDPEKGKRLDQNEIASIVREQAGPVSKDLRISVQDLSTRGFGAGRGYPVELNLKGPDWRTLEAKSVEIVDALENSGRLVDIDTNYDTGQPEIHVVPDRKAAEMRGVSVTAIGNTINAAISGRRIGMFTESGRRYDIRMRLQESARQTADDIQHLYVRNNRGELVSLSELVNIKRETALLSITRTNRERTITIYANPAPGVSAGEAMSSSLQKAAGLLPDGYIVEPGGTARTAEESFDGLLFAMILGIIVAYMILASQFNSFLHPLIILMALPFSFSGAIIAIITTGNSLNLYSFIGMILLMGIVMKNSILLVEFTNQMRREGLDVNEALMKACPIRLRPILMTSISTLAAAFPAALALGPGAESRIPMAVAVMGGMTVSTALTLFVVPCAYSLLSRFERK